MTVINSIPPMCYIGGGVFLMAVGYCVWLWRERFSKIPEKIKTGI